MKKPLPLQIGLIAGNGQFPSFFAKCAKKKGYEVYATAYKNETKHCLENHTKNIIWLHIGQIKKQIQFFKKHNIKEIVMAGGIIKTNAIKNLRPDLKAVMLLAKIKNTGDDNILRAYANVFEKEGIKVRASTFLVPEILAKEGLWTKKRPTKAQMEDIKIGWDIAKKIGELDIGQCVIVENGSILAIEAIDGTDATIKRGTSLAETDCIIIKICKPNQDFRFDVPSIGIETIEIMKNTKANFLVIEAKKTIVFDKEKIITLANKHNIGVMAIKSN